MVIIWFLAMFLFLIFIFKQECPAKISKEAAGMQAEAQRESFFKYAKFLSESTQAEKEIALQELAYAGLTDDELFILATRETN